ncbi:hypothetical protein [Marinobacter salarius]|uniref:hypothetical protein n=1 Tax=Marinobacter salarius TaxID=1420917 RepID=UPI00241E4E69|nr:hypothetical protein [Marinobacter salarius]
MSILRFGSPEYFQALDQQVNAMLAPQLSAGILKQGQANEIRAKAQRHAHSQVGNFYGRSKYDGSGRLMRDIPAAKDQHTGRVVLPFQVVTNSLDQDELLRQRKQRKAGKVRRKRMNKAA